MSSSNKTYTDEILADPVFVTNLEKDVYNMVGVFSKTTLIDLKADKGLNILRNDISTNGKGTIVNNLGDAEYTLSIFDQNDSCSLISSERGSYSAGKTAEIGMAVRLPVPLQGSQTLKWGYFSDNEGVYFLKTSNKFYVCIMRDGIETKFEQSQFNRDRMDGTTGSYKLLNFADGNIFKINFSWYGYGAIQYSILGMDSSGSQKPLPLHVFQTIGQTSTKHPCLPLSVKLDYGNIISSPISVLIAGRQYTILGTFNPIYRSNGIYSTNKVCLSDVFTPLLSIKKDVYHLDFKVNLSDISMYVSQNTYIEIRSQTTLTNSVFTTVVNSESCIQYDNISDTVVSGVILWCGVIPQNIHTKIDLNKTMLDIRQVTICGKSLNNLESSIVSYVHLNWVEEW